MKNTDGKKYFLYLLCMLMLSAGSMAQQDLSQLLKQAQKAADDAKKAHPDNGQKKDPALPPGYDNSWRVEVNITTVLTAHIDLEDKNDKKHTKTGSTTFQFQSHLSSDKNISWSNGDDIQISSYAAWDDNFKKFAKPPKGSYSLNWQSNEKEIHSDGSSEKRVFSGTGQADPALGDISLEYNKKTKLGSLVISNDNFNFNSNGAITACGKNGCQTIDGKQLSLAIANLYSALFRRCQLYNSFDVMAKGARELVEKSVNDPAGVLGVNMGIASISENEKHTMYSVTFSNSKADNTVPEGWTGTSTITSNSSISVSFFQGDPPEYDAILEYVSLPGITSQDYDHWIPEGPPVNKNNSATQQSNPSGNKGNSISFRVYLYDKKKKQEVNAVEYDAVWSLSAVSNEPGYCSNYPLNDADTKPDIIFDSIQQKNSRLDYSDKTITTKDYSGNTSIIVTSYDYGGFARLKVTVMPRYDGPPIVAHFKNDTKTEIPLPKDDNSNNIADAWEKDPKVNIYGKNYSGSWDDETQDNNGNKGDGYTLYEEYRGLAAIDANGNKQHTRLDPGKKDLCVVNKINNASVVRQRLNKFGTAARINAVELDKDGVKNEDDDYVVNFNSTTYHGGDQTAIMCVTHDFSKPDRYDIDNHVLPDNTVGYTPPKHMTDLGLGGAAPVIHSPKDVLELRINPKYVNSSEDMDFTIPHELAHGCAVVHHGTDLSFKTGKDFSEEGYKIVIKDKDGKDHPELKLSDGDLIVSGASAKPQYTSSGNVRCYMTYNQAYDYISMKPDDGTVTLLLTPYGENKKLNGKNDLSQNIFCTDPTGTVWNENGKMFGNAAVGNCMNQFNIKDWK